LFFFSSRSRHTRFSRDWSSDVCSSDLVVLDLKEPVQPKSFLLPPNEQYGHRLVIDLEPVRSNAAVKRTTAPAAPPSGRDLVVVKIGRASRRERVYTVDVV